MGWREWALWIFAALLGGGIALSPLLTRPAQPHSYYSTACCDKNDCRVIERSRVRLTSKGYIVDGRWEYSFAETQLAPADEYSLCQSMPDVRPRCLYAPMGAS